jgi:hypothetical protein
MSHRDLVELDDHDFCKTNLLEVPSIYKVSFSGEHTVKIWLYKKTVPPV